TCHLPPAPGNGRTYTSKRPDSSDWYASHRPSGEKTGSTSLKGPFENTVGLPGLQPEASSPSMGRIIKSCAVFCVDSLNARNLPLGCHDPGNWPALFRVSRCTSPVPSARCQ